MKYASTHILNGVETVCTVLPLSVVPMFDPENPPQENTYGVPDEVQIGWAKDASGAFVAPTPSLADTKQAFLTAIQQHLDGEAVAKGYDSIVSACSYAGYPNDFQAEAISFGQWRAAVWTYCYGELDKVTDGVRALPSMAEIIAEIPARVLP